MFVAALVVTGVLALANWWSRLADNDWVEEITKPLVTIGAIAVALTGGGPTKVVVVCVVALVFCLIGDIALLPRVDKFIVGLAAFLVGHLAFDVMFFVDCLRSARLAGLALVVVGIVAAVAAPTILSGAAAHKISKPVALYLLVISSMVVFGWATGNWAAMAGSVAFIISDTILGWREFVSKRPWMPVAIMVTYHLAIVLLAIAPAV